MIRIRRLLVVVVVVMLATTMLISGTSSAQSCFATVAKGGQPPGQGVSTLAKRLADPGSPRSGVPAVAHEVGFINQAREEIC